jgi:hypothetical protein
MCWKLVDKFCLGQNGESLISSSLIIRILVKIKYVIKIKIFLCYNKDKYYLNFHML